MFPGLHRGRRHRTRKVAMRRHITAAGAAPKAFQETRGRPAGRSRAIRIVVS